MHTREVSDQASLYFSEKDFIPNVQVLKKGRRNGNTPRGLKAKSIFFLHSV